MQPKSTAVFFLQQVSFKQIQHATVTTIRSLLVLIFCCLFHYSINAQKTYFKARFSYGLFGSTQGFKKGMRASGYEAKGVSSWFGGYKDYPYAEKYPYVYVEVGRYFFDKLSSSLMLGILEAGKVYGHNHTDFFKLKHHGMIAGAKLNLHKSSASFGAGPTVLWIKYGDAIFKESKYKYNKLLPGLSLSAEGYSKKPKKFKVGVFGMINLYPSFHTKSIPNAIGDDYQSTTVNPTSLQLGFLFLFQ